MRGKEGMDRQTNKQTRKHRTKPNKIERTELIN